jgi:hypothetical protein
MPNMDRPSLHFRRSMPIWLLLAWLAVDTAVFAMGTIFSSDTAQVALVLLIYGQFLVLCGWLVIGSEGIKTTAAMLGGTALLGLVVNFASSEQPVTAVSVSLLYLVAMNLPLIVARLAGFRFWFFETPPISRIGLFQIRLREIFIYTTVIAVLAALWQGAEPLTEGDGLWESLRVGLTILIYVIVVVVYLSPWIVWLLILTCRPVHAIGLSLVMLLGGAVILARIANESSSFAVGFGVMAAIAPAAMLMHMTFLQCAGFQFARVSAPFRLRSGTRLP